MSHCSDDDLLLEYYGEPSPSAAHLSACADCTARYRELKLLLDSVTLEPPDRGDRYGLEVWQAIRHRLPARQRTWFSVLTPQWGLAAAALLLLTIGFACGPPVAACRRAAAAGAAAHGRSAGRDSDDDARRRAVLMTVTDHFERSDRVLAEIMNAAGPRDLAAEQRWASDLVAASRLYRQNVIAMNEPAVAAVLDEVERVLLDIVHQPSQATAADLEEIRRRIDSAALLFKVRVMSNELQYRLEQPSPVPSTTPASTIG